MSLNIILHVEDDPEWVDNVKRVLKEEGNFFLVNAKSSSEAKKAYGDFLLNQQVPEIIILDISLALEDKNDKGGFEFIEAFKEWGFSDRTSIIILSDNVNIETYEDVFRKYKLEVVNVFRKSEFVDEIDRFIETIKQCLDKPNFKYDWADDDSNH